MAVRRAYDSYVGRDVRQRVHEGLAFRRQASIGIHQIVRGIDPRLTTPVIGFNNSLVVHEATHRLLQVFLKNLDGFTPAWESPGAEYHVRAVGDRP